MKNLNFLIILFTILLASCKSPEPLPPYLYESNPHYSWGYAEFYGPYYAKYGIVNNTLSLSLFSDSLKINDKGELTGYGQYLFLEDVFISPADTLLPLGTYRIGKNGDPFTFYAGKTDSIDAEVSTSGAYIYYIEKNSDKSKLELITEGSFNVSLLDGKFRIVFNFKTADNEQLKGSFNSFLPHFDQSVQPGINAPRNKLKLKIQ